MKIAFVPEVIGDGDSVRGIGVHTSELLRAFELEIRNLKLEITSRSEADIIHFTKFRPFFLDLPFYKPNKQKWVLTIHDLIPLIYPDHYPPGIKGKIKFFINRFLIKKNVDAIITISETSKKDICRFLGVTPDKVHVIYLALATRKTSSANIQLPNKFVLYVGDMNYNKNIPLLVKAVKKANLKLVIAGRQAKEVEAMDLNHTELGHLKGIDWSGVIRLGYVPDEEIGNLYKKAMVYIQPSLYEGFGLPVLEAFSAGCPVIVARTQALVEIAENACEYFDPENIDELIEKIRLVNFKVRTRTDLVKKGLERVKKFSWKRVARETFEVYEKVLV